MSKKNYIQSINKYNKEKMKLYSVRFHKEKQRDIIDKFGDNDKVVLIFPDESMLMSCKANLTSMLNKEVKSYEKKDDAWRVEVRYA